MKATKFFGGIALILIGVGLLFGGVLGVADSGNISGTVFSLDMLFFVATALLFIVRGISWMKGSPSIKPEASVSSRRQSALVKILIAFAVFVGIPILYSIFSLYRGY